MKIDVFLVFWRARRFLQADPDAVKRAGQWAADDEAVQRRVVWTAVLFGIIATLFYISMLAWQLTDDGMVHVTWEEIIFGPPLAFWIGVFTGFPSALAFAPERFLRGPFGEKWMRLIGVRSVLVARLVCLIVFAAITTAVSVLVLLAWHGINALR